MVKGAKTAETFSRKDCVHAFTNVSSHEAFSKGDSGVLLILQMSTKSQINVGKITSNFTLDLKAIMEALEVYLSTPDNESNYGFDDILCLLSSC